MWVLIAQTALKLYQYFLMTKYNYSNGKKHQLFKLENVNAGHLKKREQVNRTKKKKKKLNSFKFLTSNILRIRLNLQAI